MRVLFFGFFDMHVDPLVERMPLVPYLFDTHKVDEIDEIEEWREFIQRFVYLNGNADLRFLAAFGKRGVYGMDDDPLCSSLDPFLGDLSWLIDHEVDFEVFIYRRPVIIIAHYVKMYKGNL